MINESRVKKYCKEEPSKIENYDKAVADTTQIWDLHHRTEIWWNCSRKELIENECYYNRKACELIFLTHAEHKSLHNKGRPSPMKGHTLSEESRRKISEAMKGHTLSEETRRKISEANKNMSEETRRKISEAMKGKKLSEEHRRKLSEANKGKHHTEEWRRKSGEAHKGKTWKLIDGKRVWLSKEVE